jgi:hypothetical protein
MMVVLGERGHGTSGGELHATQRRRAWSILCASAAAFLQPLAMYGFAACLSHGRLHLR